MLLIRFHVVAVMPLTVVKLPETFSVNESGYKLAVPSPSLYILIFEFIKKLRFPSSTSSPSSIADHVNKQVILLLMMILHNYQDE